MTLRNDPPKLRIDINNISLDKRKKINAIEDKLYKGFEFIQSSISDVKHWFNIMCK